MQYGLRLDDIPYGVYSEVLCVIRIFLTVEKRQSLRASYPHGAKYSVQLAHTMKEEELSMQVSQTSVITNTAGNSIRIERGPVLRRVNTQYIHVQEPVFVQRPKIEDLNNLVVVHDQVEQYV